MRTQEGKGVTKPPPPVFGRIFFGYWRSQEPRNYDTRSYEARITRNTRMTLWAVGDRSGSWLMWHSVNKTYLLYTLHNPHSRHVPNDITARRESLYWTTTKCVLYLECSLASTFSSSYGLHVCKGPCVISYEAMRLSIMLIFISVS